MRIWPGSQSPEAAPNPGPRSLRTPALLSMTALVAAIAVACSPASSPAGTNSPLAIAGDRLVTAAGFPQGPDQKPALVVFQLNGVPMSPPSPPAGSPSPTVSQDPNASPPSVDNP
jgi:hypothetical protein